jgi:Lrp/AsnC family leucine-responsive transcriptional regulator
MATAVKIDRFDQEILRILQENCKISNTALAKKIGLTPPATLERVKKLEKEGFILGYQAILNKKKLGKGLACLIALDLEHHNKRKVFESVEESLKKVAEIENIYLVTGRYDYLIKVNLRDVEELREFVVKKLTKIEFIDKVETFIAISSMANLNFSFSAENE